MRIRGDRSCEDMLRDSSWMRKKAPGWDPPLSHEDHLKSYQPYSRAKCWQPGISKPFTLYATKPVPTLNSSPEPQPPQLNPKMPGPRHCFPGTRDARGPLPQSGCRLRFLCWRNRWCWGQRRGVGKSRVSYPLAASKPRQTPNKPQALKPKSHHAGH